MHADRDLASLPDSELHEYFCDHARYHASAPTSAQYQIQVGTRFLRSADTADLFDAFRAAVRGERRRKGRRNAR